jgi:hypothetical protein
MGRAPAGRLTWDLDAIAVALKIQPKDVREYFTDGRRVSFILERRIASEVLKGRVADSEGADYDLIDANGDKWEVRSITRGGVYFCPSYMVGSGRSFAVGGFVAKLDEIKGYIFADVETFPDVPFYVVSSTEVRAWWQAQQLGATTKVSRAKALKLFQALGPNP